jgi:hypothetical protein
MGLIADYVAAYFAKNRWQLPNFREGGAGSCEIKKLKKKYFDYYFH